MSDGQGQKKHDISMMPSRLLESKVILGSQYILKD